MDKSASKIQNMFSEIAPSYDKANSVLSMGIHHLWKQKLVRMSQIQPGQKVLDCATGTGDLALLYKKATGSEGQVVATDFCQEMLDLAPAKAEKENLKIDFRWADASQLPFEDNQFDVTSISFGIRNVEQRTKALEEMARVTRPGGRVMILEFGQVSTPVLKSFYNFYSETLMPKLGGWLSGKHGAYQYLNNSSQEFPCGKNFAAEIMGTGKYQKVDYKPLSVGIAYIYTCIIN